MKRIIFCLIYFISCTTHFFLSIYLPHIQLPSNSRSPLAPGFRRILPTTGRFVTAPVRNVHARCTPIKNARNQSERFTYCLCLYIFLLATGGVSGSTFVIETTDSGIMILNTSPSINSGSAPLYIKVYWFRDSRISCLFHEPLFYQPTFP